MSNVSISNPMLARAAVFAAKGGEALDTILVGIADDKDKVGTAPFRVLDWITTNMTTAEIDRLPIPGSDKTNSNNPDKWVEPVTKDGQTKNVNRSFYTDVLALLPSGKKIEATIEGLDMVKSGNSSAPDEYKVMPADERRVLRESMVNRKKNEKQAIIQAVQILQQSAKFNEMEIIKVKLLRDSKNNVRMTPKPIKVFDVNNPEDLETYSVSTFLSLKPDTAKLHGGTMAAVRQTIGRSGRDPQKTGINIKTAAEFDGVAAAVANFFKDMGETRGPKRKAFLTHLNEAGSDDLLKSMQYIYEVFDHWLAIPEIAKRIEGLDMSDDSTDDNETDDQQVAAH